MVGMADVLDPEMLVFDEFLWECLRHPHMHPGNRLVLGFHRPEDHDGCLGENGMCYWSSLLWQGDTVYRIGQHDRDVNSWWARWPD